MEERRRCAACGGPFRACPRVRDQQYCGKAECRRARRRRWQRAKRQADADYADNQARVQRAWARGKSGYWRSWRSEHPGYAQGNREKQRERDRRRSAAKASDLAKMDSIGTFSAVPSGTYLLVPQGEEDLAKMDSIIVEITLLPKA
jgi:hypothetical protein